MVPTAIFHRDASRIAKQGGWQKYERDFRVQLRNLPEEFTRTGKYREAHYELLSAVKPGILLAAST